MKERARPATAGLLFETVPQLIIISPLEGVERWLNAFPTGNIDHNLVSPATIIKGRQNPKDNIPRVAYGAYALVYIGTTNTLDSRTVPAIALRESNNNGGHYFMSLKSSRRIHSNKWVEMPTTNLQINCVHELAAMEGTDYWLGDLASYENLPVEASKTNTISYSILNSDVPNTRTSHKFESS